MAQEDHYFFLYLQKEPIKDPNELFGAYLFIGKQRCSQNWKFHGR